MAEYKLEQIVVYPVKACRGVSVSCAAISTTGFLYDREWMVVSADKGRLVAQVIAPKLVMVQPSLPVAAFRGEACGPKDNLEIRAPGMPVLRIPLKRKDVDKRTAPVVDVVIYTWQGKGLDEGNEASSWWTAYLGRSVRFVRFNTDLVERQVEFAPDGYKTGFTNTGQFLLASEASLDDLNGRLPNDVAMNRFRPNLIVGGPPAFEEDKWRSFSIVHSGRPSTFTFVHPCARCKVFSDGRVLLFMSSLLTLMMQDNGCFPQGFICSHCPFLQVPTINQENPEDIGEEPIKTMGTFRKGEMLGVKIGNGKQVFFGTYFVADDTISSNSGSDKMACVAVGDSLIVREYS